MSDKHNDEFFEWLKEIENKAGKEFDDVTSENKKEVNDIREDEEKNSENFNDTNTYYEEKVEEEKTIRNEEQEKEKILEDKNNKKNNKLGNALKITSLVLVGAVMGSFIGPFISENIFKNKQQLHVQEESKNINAQNISKDINIENFVAKKAIPSVVGIRAKITSEDQFFGEMDKENIGSGVVVSSDGYILTNAHVLENEKSTVSVLFSDKSTKEGKVVYLDSTLDLAMIKVNAKGLNAISFANSDNIQIGDKAIAIGNPIGFNLQSTLTSGYISGLERSIPMRDGTFMNGLIQTDASINSGNSGGALLNKNGELIGVNTAKVGNTDGIGFAIPSNLAKNIVDQVIKNGSYSPVMLGISGIDLNIYKQYTANTEIKVDEGVVVAEVSKNSSAEKAGIKSRDIIISIGNKKVKSMNSLKQILVSYKKGDREKITVLRNNKEVNLDIVFEGSPANI